MTPEHIQEELMKVVALRKTFQQLLKQISDTWNPKDPVGTVREAIAQRANLTRWLDRLEDNLQDVQGFTGTDVQTRNLYKHLTAVRGGMHYERVLPNVLRYLETGDETHIIFDLRGYSVSAEKYIQDYIIGQRGPDSGWATTTEHIMPHFEKFLEVFGRMQKGKPASEVTKLARLGPSWWETDVIQKWVLDKFVLQPDIFGGPATPPTEADYQRGAVNLADIADGAEQTVLRYVKDKQQVNYLTEPLSQLWDMGDKPDAFGPHLANKIQALWAEFLKRWNAAKRAEQTKRQKTVPSQFSVGQFKVILDDDLLKGPARRAGRRDETRVDAEWVERVIRGIDNAVSVLRSRKLDKLIYGQILLVPKSKAGTNHFGAEWGVGGRYAPNKDRIGLFTGLAGAEGIRTVLLHELGHRYYYKFMDRAQRLRWDDWNDRFKVPAVSKYGGNSPAEKFAEAFLVFIDPKLKNRMARDARNEFIEILRSGRLRIESVEELIDLYLESVGAYGQASQS